MAVICSPIHLPTLLISGDCIPTRMPCTPRFRNVATGTIHHSMQIPETSYGAVKTCKVQTLYRDSEAQTDPYRVDAEQTGNEGLEILTLGNFFWNNALPAGITEVKMIERARHHRAWEKALPDPVNPESVALRKMVLDAMNMDKWNVREEEIDMLNTMRMELSEKMLRGCRLQMKEMVDKRTEKYMEVRLLKRDEDMKRSKQRLSRELRKLKVRRQCDRKKLRGLDAGENTGWFFERELVKPISGRKNTKFCQSTKERVMRLVVGDVPDMEIPRFHYQKHTLASTANPKNSYLSATKWGEKQLDEVLEVLGKASTLQAEEIVKKSLRLKTITPDLVLSAGTPNVETVPEQEEEFMQACIILQKVIRGRAIQTVMWGEREKCRELIEELKSTHSIETSLNDITTSVRIQTFDKQRQRVLNAIQEKKKKEILQELEGRTNADTIDFLTKELLRLADERQVHALAILATKERNFREAAEAGRAQKEEHRRREHNEMFRQILKTHQNIVENYLVDIISKSKTWLAEREAREYVYNMAVKIDQAAREAHLRCSEIEEEELIADLVHNFLLPEAQKLIMRDRIKKRQNNYLKACHDEIFANIEKICGGDRDSNCKLRLLPCQKNHRAPLPVEITKLPETDEEDSETTTSSASTRYLSMDSTMSGIPILQPVKSQTIVKKTKSVVWSLSSSGSEAENSELLYNPSDCSVSKKTRFLLPTSE